MSVDIVRWLIACFVLAVMLGGFALLLQKLQMAGRLAHPGRRLKLVESLTVGPKHRLVLVASDTAEHLLLLGPAGDTLVTTHPRRAEEALKAALIDPARGAPTRKAGAKKSAS